MKTETESLTAFAPADKRRESRQKGESRRQSKASLSWLPSAFCFLPSGSSPPPHFCCHEDRFRAHIACYSGGGHGTGHGVETPGRCDGPRGQARGGLRGGDDAGALSLRAPARRDSRRAAAGGGRGRVPSARAGVDRK